ncbi:MAG: ATP-binding protein, partial [Bacteroidota bacterium]
DADKLEKIISNILSNSCKVSENNGKITVDIDIKENDHLKTVNNNLTSRSDLKIHISDTGPGMTEEKLSKLFDPFFSEDNRSNFSSGIGLALVNGLIKLLEGKIEVKSEHGKGTDFYISIPLIDSAPEDKLYPNKFVDKISDKNLTAIINNLEDYEPDEDTIIREENEVKYEMLIVEDNQDLSRFLHKHYSKTFKTSVAGNGMDALTKIEKSHPDIIISDVMMPVMDGNELCNTLKENIETSHIPIILLTAKSGTDSKLESLSLGADSYMNKPFNVKELDLKVKNILKYVEDTKKRFAKFDSMDESTSKMQNKELQFITSLNEIILQNINDSEFHINELCKAAYISRAHLHRKLKKSIGLSTSEFIRNVRLNEARKLLKTQKHTVSEVAFKVGYDNLGYFSTLFKKVFDEAPSFYLKEESTN